MDWKKAKILMIYVFIILDAFLLFLLYQKRTNKNKDFDIESILSKYDISLNTEIPPSFAVPKIEVTYRTFEKDEIKTKFFNSPAIEEQPDSIKFIEGNKVLLLLNKKLIIYSDNPQTGEKIESYEDAKSLAENFLKEKGLSENLDMVSGYRDDKSEKYIFSYEEKDPKTGLYVEDAFSNVYVGDYGVTDLKYQGFVDIKQLEGKTTIEDPKRKLLKIINQPVASGRAITDVDFNYYFNTKNIPLLNNPDKAISGMANLSLRVTLDNGLVLQID